MHGTMPIHAIAHTSWWTHWMCIVHEHEHWTVNTCCLSLRRISLDVVTPVSVCYAKSGGRPNFIFRHRIVKVILLSVCFSAIRTPHVPITLAIKVQNPCIFPSEANCTCCIQRSPSTNATAAQLRADGYGTGGLNWLWSTMRWLHQSATLWSVFVCVWFVDCASWPLANALCIFCVHVER